MGDKKFKKYEKHEKNTKIGKNIILKKKLYFC